MLGIIVGILVTFTMSESLRAGIMRVAKMLRDWQTSAGFYVFQRGVDGQNCAVAFVGRGNVERRFGERDSGLRPADEFGCLKRSIRQDQSHGIGKPDVLSGMDYDAPGDETRVLARMDHFGEP